MLETPQSSTPHDSPPDTTLSQPRPAANLSLANHSPEPWALFSGQTPGMLFEIRASWPDLPDIIIALIPCEEEVCPRDLADAALIKESARTLRVLRQLFATFLVPVEFRDVPEQVEAVEAASELLHDLQRAGVF